MNYSLINCTFLLPGKQATFGLPSHVFNKIKTEKVKTKMLLKKGMNHLQKQQTIRSFRHSKMFSECWAVFYYTLFL